MAEEQPRQREEIREENRAEDEVQIQSGRNLKKYSDLLLIFTILEVKLGNILCRWKLAKCILCNGK